MSLLATWAGDEAAFAALQKPLLQNLRKTRPKSKHDSNLTLSIPLTFKRYHHIKADKNKKLLHQPILHLFVVACDNSTLYKNNFIRESLINWYRTLQNDYKDYNYKQQAIVITVIGDIPRQSRNVIRNLDEISVENLETLSVGSESSGIVSNGMVSTSDTLTGSHMSVHDHENSNTLSMSSWEGVVFNFFF